MAHLRRSLSLHKKAQVNDLDGIVGSHRLGLVSRSCPCRWLMSVDLRCLDGVRQGSRVVTIPRRVVRRTGITIQREYRDAGGGGLA